MRKFMLASILVFRFDSDITERKCGGIVLVTSLATMSLNSLDVEDISPPCINATTLNISSTIDLSPLDIDICDACALFCNISVTILKMAFIGTNAVSIVSLGNSFDLALYIKTPVEVEE